MTKITSEREALLRECYEWLFESKTDGPRVSEGAIAKGYYTEAFAELHNRLQAALTREQREVPPGLYDLDPYVLPQQKAPSEQREGVTDEMVARFLGWKLPADFAPDCGITFEPVGNKGTRFEYRFEPVGTNLLTAVQAREMLEYVLATGAPTAQQPLDDEANNAGVATGSRNSSPSESVTRGNLPPSIPQQEAQGAVACHRLWSGNAPLMKMWMSGDVPADEEAKLRIAGYTIERAYTTPPAPVDVRSMLPKVTFKNVQRGDAGRYPNGDGWGHAWSAPVVEIERADWDKFLALLDGQPAGVDDEAARKAVGDVFKNLPKTGSPKHHGRFG